MIIPLNKGSILLAPTVSIYLLLIVSCVFTFSFFCHPTPPSPSYLFTSEESKTQNAAQQGACALKALPFDSWMPQLMGHVTSQLAE